MGLECAVRVFQSYLAAEYAEAVAVRTESDEVLRERRAASEEFMVSTAENIMSSAHGRAPVSPEDLKKYALTANQVAQRVLFLTVEHAHPRWGSVYAGYISGGRPTTTGSYGMLLFSVDIGGELKIAAEYLPDFYDSGPEPRWRHGQGERMDNLGEPLAAHMTVEPSRPEHLDHCSAIMHAVSPGERPSGT